MDAPNDDATTRFVFLATDPSLHVICLSRAEVIQVIESLSLGTTPMISLLRISWRRQNARYINTTQLSSSVTWITDINLFDKDGTRSVWESERDGEMGTVLAPVTGYATPLTLVMQTRHGCVVWEKSLGSKVMWSVASESMIQTPLFRVLELHRTCPQLPQSLTVVEDQPWEWVITGAWQWP